MLVAAKKARQWPGFSVAASPFRPCLRCPFNGLLSLTSSRVRFERRHAHRSGLIVAGGLGQIARRYAVDWKRRKDGAFFSGDPRDVRSYHAYGADVHAVADATVVLAKDGLPHNIPRTAAGFETAVPVTMETVAGNSVALDLGDGQYA